MMRKIKIIILTIALLLPVILTAQSSRIAGQLIDSEQQPLPGANIYLEGTILGSASGDEGRFVIANVPPGKFLLKISMIGHRQVDTLLTVGSGSEIDLGRIILPEIPLQSQPIVVTASKYEQNLQDVPLSIATVSAQEISFRNTRTVDEALRYVSGVSLNRDQVNIRGSNGYSHGVGSRVMLLIDGVPYITGDTQGITFSSIPVNRIDRIEVQKSAGSTLYGSNALGGVINILTKPISENRDMRIRVYGGLFDSPYHSQWEWSDKSRFSSGISAEYSQKSGPIGFRVSAARDENDSHRKNDWSRRYNLSAKVEYDLTPFDLLTISGNYTDQNHENFLYWKNLDNALLPADDQVGDLIKTQRYYLAPTYRKVFGPKQFLKISAIWYRSNVEDNIIPGGNRSDSDFAYLEFQYNILLGRHFLTMGVTPTLSRVFSDMFGDRNAHTLAAYVQDEINLNSVWKLTAGIRYDYYQMRDLGSGNRFNPKLGLVYKSGESSAFRASLGSGYRAPSVAEAFTSTSAAGLVVIPNPDLKPESSVSGEVGWNRYFGTDAMADVALYYNYFWDMIEGRFISDPPRFVNSIRFENITEARVYGVEVNLNWQVIHEKLLFHVGYTWNRSKDISTEKVLKYRPEHLLYTDARLRMGQWWLGADYRYISRHEEIDDAFARIISDAQERVPVHIVDVRVSREIFPESLNLNLSFEVKNLLQYNYVDLIGSVAPIRQFLLSAEINL